MGTIDYTKFKIEIYSPAAALIKEASINSGLCTVKIFFPRLN